eukprot:gene26238-17336_t
MRICVRAVLLLLFCEIQQSWLTSVNATGIPRALQSPKGQGGSFTYALWLQPRSSDVHTWTLGTSPDGWFLSFNVQHGAKATQVTLVLPSQSKSSDALKLLSPHLLDLHSWHHVVIKYNPVPHRTNLCVDGRCTTLTLNRTAVAVPHQGTLSTAQCTFNSAPPAATAPPAPPATAPDSGEDQDAVRTGTRSTVLPRESNGSAKGLTHSLGEIAPAGGAAGAGGSAAAAAGGAGAAAAMDSCAQFLLGEGLQGGSSSSGDGPRIHDAELWGEELSDASIDWLQATSCPSYLAVLGQPPAIDESMIKAMMGSQGSEAWQWSCQTGQLCDYATVPCPSSGCSYEETSLQQTSKASAGLSTKSLSRKAATRKFGFGSVSIGRKLEELVQEEVGCDHAVKVYFSEMIGLAVALNIVAILALALAFYVYHLRLKTLSDCGRASSSTGVTKPVVAVERASAITQDQPIHRSLNIQEPLFDPDEILRLPSGEIQSFENILAYTPNIFSVDEAPPSFLSLMTVNASPLHCSDSLAGKETPIANRPTPHNHSSSQPQIESSSKSSPHSRGQNALQRNYSSPVLRTVWSMLGKKSSSLSSRDASQKRVGSPQTDNPLYSRERPPVAASLYHAPPQRAEVKRWIELPSTSLGAEDEGRFPPPANSTGAALMSVTQQSEVGLPSANWMPPQSILLNQNNSLGWGPAVPSPLPPARPHRSLTTIAEASSLSQSRKEPSLIPETNELLMPATGIHHKPPPADNLKPWWLVGSSSSGETRGMPAGQWPEKLGYTSNSSISTPNASFRSSSKIQSLGICEVLPSAFNQAPAPVDEAWLPVAGNGSSKLCLIKDSPGSLSHSRCSSTSQARLHDVGPSCTTLYRHSPGSLSQDRHSSNSLSQARLHDVGHSCTTHQDRRSPNYPYPELGGLSPMAQARGSQSFHPPASASPTSLSSTRGGSSLYRHVSMGVTSQAGQDPAHQPGFHHTMVVIQDSMYSSSQGSSVHGSHLHDISPFAKPRRMWSSSLMKTYLDTHSDRLLPHSDRFLPLAPHSVLKSVGIGGNGGGQESPCHPGTRYGDLKPLIIQSSVDSSGLGSPLGSERGAYSNERCKRSLEHISASYPTSLNAGNRGYPGLPNSPHQTQLRMRPEVLHTVAKEPREKLPGHISRMASAGELRFMSHARFFPHSATPAHYFAEAAHDEMGNSMSPQDEEARRIRSQYNPGLLETGYASSDDFQHMFLGSSPAGSRLDCGGLLMDPLMSGLSRAVNSSLHSNSPSMSPHAFDQHIPQYHPHYDHVPRNHSLSNLHSQSQWQPRHQYPQHQAHQVHTQQQAKSPQLRQMSGPVKGSGLMGKDSLSHRQGVPCHTIRFDRVSDLQAEQTRFPEGYGLYTNDGQDKSHLCKSAHATAHMQSLESLNPAFPFARCSMPNIEAASRFAVPRLGGHAPRAYRHQSLQAYKLSRTSASTMPQLDFGPPDLKWRRAHSSAFHCEEFHLKQDDSRVSQARASGRERQGSRRMDTWGGSKLNRIQSTDVTVVTACDPILPGLRLDLKLHEEVQVDTSERLGSGAFGTVYRGTYNSMSVAVKLPHLSIADVNDLDGALATLLQEVTVLSRVRHPNVVLILLNPQTLILMPQEVMILSCVQHTNVVLILLNPKTLILMPQEFMIISRVRHPNVVLILLNPQTLILMPQEVTILSRVRHPNVVLILLNPQTLILMPQEVTILSRVRHPNVVLILLNSQTLILMPQEVTVLSRVRHPNVVLILLNPQTLILMPQEVTILSRVRHPNVVLILLNPQTLILMPQEVTILSRVRHPNVVRFYGASITPPVFIVSELMHQDLGTLIHSRPSRLSLNEALG